MTDAPRTRLPRLAVSAPHRSSGKSTVATGLCAAIRARGVTVQPFKKGPDFIDPMWLTAAAGRQCRNLDFFMAGAGRIREIFAAKSAGAGLSLVECNHGLHDGVDLEGSDSSAALARLLDLPVLLVVRPGRMSRGVAPLVLGQKLFDPEVNIAGIVLNGLKSPRHEEKIRASLERYCDTPVLGVIPHRRELEIAERHLGLTPLKEDPALSSRLDLLSRAMEEHLDIERLVAIAAAAPPLRGVGPSPPAVSQAGERVRIGVAMDRAFTFTYPENLEALEEAGADLVPFSPLSDGELPQVDGLYIGGGFPEHFMEELEQNAGFREELKAAIFSGMPAWAECGGLMYLSRSLSWKGRSRRMAGVLPCEVEMQERPAAHGYVLLEGTGGSPWPQSDRVLRGHEFHHSRIVNLGEKARFAYRTRRGSGSVEGKDGIVTANCIATYTHLHRDGAPSWATDFVSFARERKKGSGATS